MKRSVVGCVVAMLVCAACEAGDIRCVLLITSRGCGPCNRIKASTLPALSKSGWSIREHGAGGAAHIWTVDVDRNSAVAKRFCRPVDELITAPQWVLVVNGQAVRWDSGVKSPTEVDLFLRSEATAVKRRHEH